MTQLRIVASRFGLSCKRIQAIEQASIRRLWRGKPVKVGLPGVRRGVGYVYIKWWREATDEELEEILKWH